MNPVMTTAAIALLPLLLTACSEDPAKPTLQSSPEVEKPATPVILQVTGMMRGKSGAV